LRIKISVRGKDPLHA